MSTTDTIRAAFEAAYLSANGFHTKAELANEWKEGMLSSHMFRAGWKAAKATGTAGEPKLPKPIAQIGRFMDESTDVFDGSQMRAYGQACAEAARQPAPAMSQAKIHDITIQEACKIGGGLVDEIPADDLTALGRAIAERILAATRSQP